LEDLKKCISSLNGIDIEEKKGGFALHYRRFRGDEENIHPERLLKAKKFLRRFIHKRIKEKVSRTFLT